MTVIKTHLEQCVQHSFHRKKCLATACHLQVPLRPQSPWARDRRPDAAFGRWLWPKPGHLGHNSTTHRVHTFKVGNRGSMVHSHVLIIWWKDLFINENAADSSFSPQIKSTGQSCALTPLTTRKLPFPSLKWTIPGMNARGQLTF